MLHMIVAFEHHEIASLPRNDGTRALWNICVCVQSNKVFQLARQLKKLIRFLYVTVQQHYFFGRPALKCPGGVQTLVCGPCAYVAN